jgi:hypothetical protein
MASTWCVNSEALDASSTVKAYKQLSNAELAFCSLKTIDIAKQRLEAVDR